MFRWQILKIKERLLIIVLAKDIHIAEISDWLSLINHILLGGLI